MAPTHDFAFVDPKQHNDHIMTIYETTDTNLETNNDADEHSTKATKIEVIITDLTSSVY